MVNNIVYIRLTTLPSRKILASNRTCPPGSRILACLTPTMSHPSFRQHTTALPFCQGLLLSRSVQPDVVEYPVACSAWGINVIVGLKTVHLSYMEDGVSRVDSYALKKILFRYKNQSVNHLVINVLNDRIIG